MNQSRNPQGRFTPSRTTAAAIIITGLSLGVIIANYTLISPWLAKMNAAPLTATNPVSFVTVAHADAITPTTPDKIEALQWQVVDAIATKCETLNHPEPDAAIILDSNNQMSLGAWMYQIKTVQHYIHTFENRDISRVEAIQIAIDHTKARELTFKIVFNDSKGLDNWYNCAHKLNLYDRVALLKELTK